MLKYRVTALALKGFSSCAPARRLYRALGNAVGGGARTAGRMPYYYFERVERNVAHCRRFCPLQADDVVLELGTGWVHWEAITLRLFFDFQAVLYDVWDNRQLRALKSYVGQLAARFGQDGFLAGCDFDRARHLVKQIEGAATFNELYRILGFRYEMDPSGLMERLPRSHFRLAISAGVMEHIPEETAQRFISNMASCLRPGGFAMHSIDTTDHLYLYDRTANPKQYLAYSDRQWRRWFENGVQYINRIQRSRWLDMFARAGFELLEEGGSTADLAGLAIDPLYRTLSRKDMECTILNLVARKSAA